MDPANPPRPRPQGSMSMSQVQKWVMSVLAVTTIGHLSAGLVIAAVFLDENRTGARVGLDLIAGVIGVLGVAAGFLIHGRRPFTPWLLAGLIPAAIGLYVIL
jgi:hypothetical protein